MKTKETSTYKTKGLEIYITNALSRDHAVASFIYYRIGVTENDIELFEGKIPDIASVMPAIEMKTRQLALAWFNGLASDGLRAGYAEKHIKQGFRYKSLTGLEIELIWLKETQGLSEIPEYLTERTFVAQMFNSRPNQKQFKKFSKELFKSYIDKFSQENKALMLQILIDDLGVRELVDVSVRSSEKV